MKQGEITYRFETPVYSGNILYVNLIARYSCVNNCLFCSKPETYGKENIYEQKAGANLFLSKSPSVETVIALIDKKIQKKDTEIAFIGLGEPLMYLPKVIKIIKKIKEKYDIKTRVDTNGLVKCMYKDPVKKLVDAGLDEIRISLNAITKKEYDILCRPRFENAFENLISFVKECANSKIYTYVSFVTGFEHEKVKKRTEEEYSKFAESLGIKKENMILRKYVKGIFKK